MTTPSPDGPPASEHDAARWAEPGTAVSLGKAPRDDVGDPAAFVDAAFADAAFDPYRFGRPEHPVPAQYAPPGYEAGYVPPPSMPTAGPPVWGAPGYGPPAYGPPGPGAPPQFPPYGYPPPPFSQYPQPRTGNGKAIAALVLGALSIVFSVFSLLDLLLIIPAVVLGSLALTDSKRTGSGRSLAIGGFVCAAVGAVLAAALTIWLYPQVQRCVNDYPTNSAEYNTCIRDIVR